MKLKKEMMGLAAVMAVVGVLLAPMDGDARGTGYGQGGGRGQQGCGAAMVANLPMEDLSVTEEVGLAKMREEEKLARDVYQLLYQKWNMQVFSNIARSEQQHMNSVKVILDKYSLPDPVVDSTAGVFTDPELAELYLNLTEQGQLSLIDALTVGAIIEDLDIKDLYDLLEETDSTDIRIVYQNLAKGSRNHLRAYTYQLSLLGVEYEARFLTAEQIAEIISAPRERGRVDENGEAVVGNSDCGQRRGMAGSRYLLIR